jgi:adenylate cyclase
MKVLTREFGPRSPLSSESAKSFRKFSEWECRTIPTIYAFGPFRLDAQGETLFKGTEAVALSHRAVALLRMLVDRAGTPVTKDALMEAAWPGLAVEESNLTVQIAALRRALGEVPGGESWIATLPRRGYRYVGPAVTKSEDRVPATPTVDAATRPAPMMALALPDQPSIAVLPFENLSGDPEQGYFVDGMVEEIITALSRIRWFFVIARNSSFTYKGQAVDVKQIGRELGVRYVLEGSVRKAAGRVRITAQLIEAETATHLWADRFEGSLEDVFDLQDQVAISVAGGIEPAVRTAEIRRALDRPRHDPTAYDLYLRSLRATLSWEKNDYLEALEWLSQAIKLDDTYGPALALSALYHMALNQNGWVDDPEATRQKAIWFARRAVRNAGTDAATLARAAWALAYAGEDIDAAIALMHQSLHINPSLADGWRWSGWLRLWVGSPDMAIDHLKKSLRLDPLDPARATSLPTGVAHFFARRLEQARTALLRSLHEHPNWVPTSCFLASCYAHLGQLDEAKIIIKRLRASTPVVRPNADQWRDPEQREFYLSGLRLAMSETE